VRLFYSEITIEPLKKIPHIDPQGKLVKPDEPNGVKLETFIFDAIPLAERSIVLQTLRSEEFAPVKNATGTDSAEVTRTMMIERAAKWLESAGIEIPRTADGQPDCTIEISPSFAMCAEDITAKLDQVPTITSGDEIYLDLAACNCWNLQKL
jgi:UDP-N-acetylglucosamine/UDP-N-acetylgalactosamine diphosphorylase